MKWTVPEMRFNDWLAGFIDGEGCFRISRRPDRPHHPAYHCNFGITVRRDDEAILRQIVESTGLGQTQRIKAHPPTSPSCRWSISSKAGCAGLVAILDDHPLRAKKARDYEIWREAVAVWHQVPKVTSRTHGYAEVWAQMGELAADLSALRRYREEDA